MRPLLMPLCRLLLQVLLLLVFFFLSRAAFTLINRSHFAGLTIAGFLRIAFFAIRYDLSAICAVNAAYFILLLLPLPIWRMPRWERGLQVFFILCNSIAFLFELSDWAYFPYNFKRATADVLKMVSRQGDFWSVLPGYLVAYWYVPLAAAAFIFGLIKANNRICYATPLTAPTAGRRWLVPPVQLVLLIFVVSLAAVGIRGGIQYIPIGLRNAVQVADSRYVPIVLNTPFSIITTLTTPSLEEVHYMDNAEAMHIMPFRHQYSSGTARKKNVVVIILESCSKEFTSLGNGRSYTPFLDSLMSRSLVCTQAFANGQTSAEGIPAIIAGIPTLMDEAYTTSNYGTNRITALPSALREWGGYSTAFFHGGTNGTMSFDIFSSAAGYEHYYGRKEYGNERDYDGAWGIRDEPFLQYTAQMLSQMKQPFFASVFTLSAHPPYGLPEEYRRTLPKGPLPVQQCIAYTDLALHIFFETASHQPWYDSTLFVITADHCSPQNGGGYYAAGMGQFAIPLFFYAPGDTALHGTVSEPVQQLDILPSVLQYLGYNKPFFAFGNSIFSPQDARFVITYSGDNYQWLSHSRVLQTTGITARGLYRFPEDSLCRNNVVQAESEAREANLRALKAFIQRYNAALLHNAMQ